MYLSRTPEFVKNAFPHFTWNIPTSSKELFLTFDDGPVPGITEFVLETLQKYKAKATFFCVGSNIEQHPEIFRRLEKEGHTVGSHSFDHLSGWTTDNETYFENVYSAAQLVNSKMFRPPYGRIKMSQAKDISKELKIIMWDVMSGDFDQNISVQKCFDNVVNNVKNGSIIVFHDSYKSEHIIRQVLPKVLAVLSERGYEFKSLNPSHFHSLN